MAPPEGFEPSDSWFRRPAPNPLAEAIVWWKAEESNPNPFLDRSAFETVLSPAQITFQNTHNERALAYLLWHTQPVYDYTASILFRNPGFLLCVLTGSE